MFKKLAGAVQNSSQADAANAVESAWEKIEPLLLAKLRTAASDPGFQSGFSQVVENLHGQLPLAVRLLVPKTKLVELAESRRDRLMAKLA